MNPDEKIWVSSYKKGSIYLYNSGNDYDTLFVTFVDIGNSRFPFYISESGVRDYNAGGIIHYHIVHNGLHIGGSLIAVKESDFVFSIRLDLDNRFSDKMNNDSIKLCEYKSNGSTYDDCLIIDTINSNVYSYFINQNIIKSFTWSKSKGLVNYTLEDGSVYRLYSNYVK